MDRAELAGTGAAIAFHAALIAALSLSLAHVVHPPETPPMEVEMVDEVGLQPSAPSAVAAPPPPAQAPQEAQIPPQPEPAAAPLVQPAPQPKVAPANSLAAQAAQLRPATPRPVPAKPASSRPAPAQLRASRIGADFLKGIADAAPSSTPARAAAPTISASAMAGIQQAIRRQVQPCADRQVNPGPGASRIKVKLHLVLDRSGRLVSAPVVVGTNGVDDDNSRYEERVKDLAVSIISGCSPLTGLPPELYKPASGQGWGNFILNYNLP
ncbi:MAG: cell envelope biogenesis protein TolA [Sphingomicrobium sp.]